MRILRRAWGQPLGLPAPLPALVAGAPVMGTETELVLKSRWVVPPLLRRHGFQFRSTLDGCRGRARDPGTNQNPV